MAWTANNPVSTGGATKKSDYDKLWDNAAYLKATPSFAAGIGIGGIAAGTGGVAFPATAVAVADANTLDDYDEYTAASAACTGAITTAAVWRLTKIGNKVTLLLPNVTGAGVATTYFQFGTAIPAKYRPAVNIVQICAVYDNAADSPTPGIIFVDSSNGTIRVYRNMNFTGNFTVTANAGLNVATCVSWII